MANEANIATVIDRREAAFRATIDQTTGAAVFMGGKKAAAAFNKLIRELTDGD